MSVFRDLQTVRRAVVAARKQLAADMRNPQGQGGFNRPSEVAWRQLGNALQALDRAERVLVPTSDAVRQLGAAMIRAANTRVPPTARQNAQVVNALQPIRQAAREQGAMLREAAGRLAPFRVSARGRSA